MATGVADSHRRVLPASRPCERPRSAAVTSAARRRRQQSRSTLTARSHPDRVPAIGHRTQRGSRSRSMKNARSAWIVKSVRFARRRRSGRRRQRCVERELDPALGQRPASSLSRTTRSRDGGKVFLSQSRRQTQVTRRVRRGDRAASRAPSRRSGAGAVGSTAVSRACSSAENEGGVHSCGSSDADSVRRHVRRTGRAD